MLFENCRFNGSTFKGARWMSFGSSPAVTGCSFDGCVFKNLTFSSATFKNCTFNELKKTSRLKFYACPLLENCHFSGEICKAQIDAEAMKNCTFSGTLTDCMFENSGLPDTPVPMENIDCTQAELILCGIQNYDFSTVKVSKNNCLARVTDELHRRALEIAAQAAENREKLLDHVESDCRVHPQAPFHICHPDDLIRVGNGKHYTPEFSRQLYDCICRAAEETHTRIA